MRSQTSEQSIRVLTVSVVLLTLVSLIPSAVAYSKNMGVFSVCFGEETLTGVVGQSFSVVNQGHKKIDFMITDAAGNLQLLEPRETIKPRQILLFNTAKWETGTYTITFSSPTDGREQIVKLTLGEGPPPQEGTANSIGTFSVCFTLLCLGGPIGDTISLDNRGKAAVTVSCDTSPEGWSVTLKAGDAPALESTAGWATRTHVLKFASPGRAPITANLVLGTISPAVNAALIAAQARVTTGGPIIGGQSGAAVPGAVVYVINPAGDTVSCTVREDGSFMIFLMNVDFDYKKGDELEVMQKVANMPTSRKVKVIAKD